MKNIFRHPLMLSVLTVVLSGCGDPLNLNGAQISSDQSNSSPNSVDPAMGDSDATESSHSNDDSQSTDTTAPVTPHSLSLVIETTSAENTTTSATISISIIETPTLQQVEVQADKEIEGVESEIAADETQANTAIIEIPNEISVQEVIALIEMSFNDAQLKDDAVQDSMTIEAPAETKVEEIADIIQAAVLAKAEVQTGQEEPAQEVSKEVPALSAKEVKAAAKAQKELEAQLAKNTKAAEKASKKSK